MLMLLWFGVCSGELLCVEYENFCDVVLGKDFDVVMMC